MRACIRPQTTMRTGSQAKEKLDLHMHEVLSTAPAEPKAQTLVAPKGLRTAYYYVQTRSD